MPDTAVPEPPAETNYERARRIYLARSPWRYDPRFHVAARHIWHVPVFREPPPTAYRLDLDREY